MERRISPTQFGGMFLISLVPFNVCETYNDEQTSLALLHARPSYIWSRVFDALWHITCTVLKDFKIRWPVVYFSRSLPTHCIVNTLYNFNTLHCQHTPCPLATVPLRRLTFYVVFMFILPRLLHL